MTFDTRQAHLDYDQLLDVMQGAESQVNKATRSIATPPKVVATADEPQPMERITKALEVVLIANPFCIF